jgi:hypothetical protein
MSAVQIQGNASGTGTLTIAAPSTNTNRTLTLPDNTGTLLSTGSTFAGTGPAFSAYINASQSIPNATYTKLQLNTKEFDTNSNYDNVTNYRFLPTVAGYYQINGQYGPSGAATGLNSCAIYKNGSVFKYGSTGSNSTVSIASNVSALISFNGSTDYVELWVFQSSGGAQGTIATATSNYFQGFLVRAA